MSIGGVAPGGAAGSATQSQLPSQIQTQHSSSTSILSDPPLPTETSGSGANRTGLVATAIGNSSAGRERKKARRD
ncbi:hypothetical protein CBOM_01489 [Ceraceosorus bombacis]|uniref:Uncharacterized protein n=1 Tax=Ceraceosorus bombacis TaxID=401625 RepID=A0A0P1BDD6_9BASI|nr:hypothetical protein CBOM_01489 [Ceraceosorus bombacis]